MKIKVLKMTILLWGVHFQPNLPFNFFKTLCDYKFESFELPKMTLEHTLGCLNVMSNALFLFTYTLCALTFVFLRNMHFNFTYKSLFNFNYIQ